MNGKNLPQLDDTPRTDKLRRLRRNGIWSMKHHRSQKRAQNLRTPRRHRPWNKPRPKDDHRLIGWRAFA